MQQQSRQLIVIAMLIDDQENTMYVLLQSTVLRECLTSLLPFKVVAMSLCHIVMLNAD